MCTFKMKCYVILKMDNMDQDQIKCHINIVKWLGIISTILTIICMSVYVLASMEWSNNDPLDYEVKVESNQTGCSYLKQFDLQDNVMLSACHRDGELSIDIRLFLNKKATIRGIPLNLVPDLGINSLNYLCMTKNQYYLCTTFAIKMVHRYCEH